MPEGLQVPPPPEPWITRSKGGTAKACRRKSTPAAARRQPAEKQRARSGPRATSQPAARHLLLARRRAATRASPARSAPDTGWRCTARSAAARRRHGLHPGPGLSRPGSCGPPGGAASEVEPPRGQNQKAGSRSWPFRFEKDVEEQPRRGGRPGGWGPLHAEPLAKAASMVSQSAGVQALVRAVQDAVGPRACSGLRPAPRPFCAWSTCASSYGVHATAMFSSLPSRPGPGRRLPRGDLGAEDVFTGRRDP